MAILLLLVAPPLQGEELPRRRLSAITRRVALESKRLQQVEARQARVRHSIDRQKEIVAALRLDEWQTERAFLILENEVQRLDSQMHTTASLIAEVMKKTKERVRGLFLQSRTSQMERLLARFKDGDLVRDAIFLKKMSLYDRQLVQELILLNQALVRHQSRIKELLPAREVMARQLWQQQSAVNVAMLHEEQLYNEYDQQRLYLEQSLTALNAEASRLEKMVHTITAGERETGGGLPGQLLKPVEGTVVQGFGRHKVSGFEDFVFQKGIEYKTSPRTRVAAIADGVARFVGTMPGYGKLVILDHGRRDYSLYGRLDSISVKSGQTVKEREMLGLTGELDKKGRNFYFEIRHRGVPKNPSLFLR